MAVGIVSLAGNLRSFGIASPAMTALLVIPCILMILWGNALRRFRRWSFIAGLPFLGCMIWAGAVEAARGSPYSWIIILIAAALLFYLWSVRAAFGQPPPRWLYVVSLAWLGCVFLLGALAGMGGNAEAGVGAVVAAPMLLMLWKVRDEFGSPSPFDDAGTLSITQAPLSFTPDSSVVVVSRSRNEPNSPVPPILSSHRFCSNCGKQSKEGAKFCSACGQAI